VLALPLDHGDETRGAGSAYAKACQNAVAPPSFAQNAIPSREWRCRCFSKRRRANAPGPRWNLPAIRAGRSSARALPPTDAARQGSPKWGIRLAIDPTPPLRLGFSVHIFKIARAVRAFTKRRHPAMRNKGERPQSR
jgi:hypothetical protein